MFPPCLPSLKLMKYKNNGGGIRCLLLLRKSVVYWYSIQQPLHRGGYVSLSCVQCMVCVCVFIFLFFFEAFASCGCLRRHPEQGLRVHLSHVPVGANMLPAVTAMPAPTIPPHWTVFLFLLDRWTVFLFSQTLHNRNSFIKTIRRSKRLHIFPQASKPYVPPLSSLSEAYEV
jgi:hypothetical protein